MRSTVETNVKVSQSVKLKNPDTPYPFSQTYVTGSQEEIVPYMARVYSPVRVTQYNSPNMQVKRKSRVDDVAKNSVFNLRPLKRGDKVTSWHRFRSPDATLPSVRYTPNWVSITRSDYIDPRICNESEISIGNSPPPLVRSFTDIGLSIPRIDTPATRAISVTSQVIKTPQLITSRTDSQNTNRTPLTEKKVTIMDPLPNGEKEILETPGTSTTQKSPTPVPVQTSSPALTSSPSQKSKMKNIKLPDTGVNYYSGYLPPEFSERIAEELHFNHNSDVGEVDKRYQFLGKDGQHYKPLVGDRTWFMKDPYPTQPKLYQSDIDQIRFEGHRRLLKSNGQAPSHFSVLKRNGPSIRPSQNGAHLEEAMRDHQRLAKSAIPTNKRVPNVSTSIDMFERQREKTYHLQRLAKEMLNN